MEDVAKGIIRVHHPNRGYLQSRNEQRRLTIVTYVTRAEINSEVPYTDSIDRNQMIKKPEQGYSLEPEGSQTFKVASNDNDQGHRNEDPNDVTAAVNAALHYPTHQERIDMELDQENLQQKKRRRSQSEVNQNLKDQFIQPGNRIRSGALSTGKNTLILITDNKSWGQEYPDRS